MDGNYGTTTAGMGCILGCAACGVHVIRRSINNHRIIYLTVPPSNHPLAVEPGARRCVVELFQDDDCLADLGVYRRAKEQLREDADVLVGLMAY